MGADLLLSRNSRDKEQSRDLEALRRALNGCGLMRSDPIRSGGCRMKTRFCFRLEACELFRRSRQEGRMSSVEEAVMVV